MDAPLLLTSVLVTAYFVIGSRLEERKLLAQYGEAYARYRALVPGLLPRPWRHLSAAQASELEQRARDII
jgi:cell division protein FtsL